MDLDPFFNRVGEIAAALAERRRREPMFRRQFAVLVAIGTFGLLISCISGGLLIGRVVAPNVFGPGPGGFGNQTSQLGIDLNPTFPIATSAAVNAVPGAIVRLPVANITATPLPSPSPSATIVATATILATPPPPSCPVVPSPPIATLSGGTARAGTFPAPMLAGCPAVLIVHAPAQAGAPLIITLYFGKTFQPPCIIAMTTPLDAKGEVTVAFTVPPATCFRGSILTSGTISAGADTSSNANMPAIG